MQFVNGEAKLFLRGLREHVSPLGGPPPADIIKNDVHTPFFWESNFGENPLPLLIPHQGVILEEFSVAVQFGSR